MAKRKDKMFGLKNLPIENEGAPPPDVEAAMPIPISNGVKYSQDYAEIPCDTICEFQKKDPYDVISKEDPEFQALVVSIAENGVYDAIIVRPVLDTNLLEKGIAFEVLAGHHRLAASKQLGKQTIIAKIIRDCNDEEAEDIYRVTNLLRKKQSIREQAYGWWHYFRMTRYKSEEDIAEMISQGIINESYNIMRDSKGNKQLRRYARLHELTDQMLALVEKKQVSIKFGEQISFIDKKLQDDLLPYKASLKSIEKAKKLRALANGEIEGEKWSSEAISKILFPQTLESDENRKANADTEFMNQVREIIPSAFHEPDSMLALIQDAMNEYFKAHPDKLQSM